MAFFPMRDDNPRAIKPAINWILIFSNVVAFFWMISDGPELFEGIISDYGFIPFLAFEQGEWFRFLTSIFLHGGFLHLFGNMLFLWIFGDNIEDACGHLSYIFFYTIMGVFGSLGYALTTSDPAVPAIGASGAISGILGGYVLLFPRARILTGIPFGYVAVWIPAYVMIIGWFLWQLALLPLALQGVGGVAYGAHIGGFIAGLALIKVFQRRPVAKGPSSNII